MKMIFSLFFTSLHHNYKKILKNNNQIDVFSSETQKQIVCESV
jgi:hypothetical protein